MRWNRVYNLTAVRDPQQMIPRHLLDSLAVLPYLRGATVLDVGSGAGIPGIPLAIASPERQFALLDSQAKRTRFLRQAQIELELGNVEVVHARAEAYQPQRTFDIVLARAFAELAELIALAGHLCAPTGELLAMKGAYPAAEIEGAPSGWEVVAVERLIVPGLAGERHLVRLRRASGARTPGGSP